MKTNTNQTGMTLIEIMIALLIGAFLLGGVIEIFIGSKQTYRMQDNLSRLQENGRFAMGFLSEDIRMAGYWACMSPSTPNQDIAGTEGGSATVPDTITLRAAFDPALLPPGACGDAVTAIPTPDIPANFYTDRPSSIITYSINNNSNGIPTLRRATDGVSIANYDVYDVVEGIENMQILYGVDTDAAGTANYGTPNYYATATNVPNMASVVSIRITITVRTIDDNVVQKTTANPSGRITRDFTSTIAVRNRLP